MHEPAHPALTRGAFAVLLQRFQRQSFGDEQLSVLRAAIRGGGYFTCEQTGQLLRASAFGDDRGKIAATLYPRLVDPENFAQLVSTLTSEADRQTMHNLVGP